MSSPFIIRNIHFHRILILLESLLTSHYIIYALALLSNQSTDKFLSAFLQISFHDINYATCLSTSLGFLSLILFSCALLFHIITIFISESLSKCPKLSHIISFVYNVVFYRHLSIIFIESFSFHLINTSVISYHIALRLVIGAIYGLYIIIAFIHIRTFSNYISINEQALTSSKTVHNVTTPLEYPFDIFFSKVFDQISLCGKVVITLGLHYRKNQSPNRFMRDLLLYVYLALIIVCYLYYIGSVGIFKMYHLFALNRRINGFRFILLQMNVCFIVCFLWMFSSSFYSTLFFLSYFSSAVISVGLAYVFRQYFLMKALRTDLFSLHQMLFLLGNGSANSEETLTFLSEIVISHIAVCNKRLNYEPCEICELKKSSFSLDDYFTIYYNQFMNKSFTLRTNQCKEYQLAFQLIRLYVLYKKREVYSFYQRFISLQAQSKSNPSFKLNLSSLFHFLIEQNVNDKARVPFYATFFKIKKINSALEAFLGKISALINEDTSFNSLHDFIAIGNSICSIKHKLTKLEGFQRRLLAGSFGKKAHQDISDTCSYVFSIVKFSSSFFLHNEDNDSHMSDTLWLDNGINEEFIEYFYRNDKTFIIQMIKDPLQFRFNLVIAYNRKRVYPEANEVNFIKIFPKTFQRFCERKFIDCINQSLKCFHFFLIDVNDYLVDFQLNFILILFEEQLIIKGLANYNKESLILFRKGRLDDDFSLCFLSQRASQLMKIDPRINEYSKQISCPLCFNDIFLANEERPNAYYINSHTYSAKLQRITASFLDSKLNAPHTEQLNGNILSIQSQLPIEVTLLELDMLKDNEGLLPNESYQMYFLEERKQKSTVKHNTNKTQGSKASKESLNYAKVNYGSSSTAHSALSENTSLENRHRGHKRKAQQRSNKFSVLSIVVACCDIGLVLISIVFVIVESILNDKIKAYYAIFVHEKRIECYLAHMTIQALMTPCIYNEEATNADDRLIHFSDFLEMDIKPFLFIELREKSKVFDQLKAEFNINVYSSADANIRKFVGTRVGYSHVSHQLKENQISILREEVLFSEALNLFENNINEIVTSEDEDSCDERSLSVFYSDGGKLYFSNLSNVLLSGYQRSMYEIIINYTVYYEVFAEIKVLLYAKCQSLYQTNIGVVMIFAIVMFSAKMLIIGLCFVTIAYTKSLLMENYEEIRSKISNKNNLNYFNALIKNIRLLCQLYGDNPLSLMYEITKSKKEAERTPQVKKSMNSLNSSADKSYQRAVKSKKSADTNESFFTELWRDTRAFLLIIVFLATIISFAFPLLLVEFLTEMRIVIEYSNINSSIEINMFLAGVLTQLMLFSNQANLPMSFSEKSSMTSKENILALIQTLLFDVAQKDKYRTVYLSTLDSLNYVIVTNNCPDTFNKIDDEILISIRNRGELDYAKFYVTVCDKFNYNFIDYYYSSYDIQYRLEKFLKASISTPYARIFEDLNILESMKVLSVIIYISRPVMNFFNSKALQDKFIAVTNTYVLVLAIGLLLDFLINLVVFYYMRQMIAKKLQRITYTVSALNQSLQIKGES